MSDPRVWSPLPRIVLSLNARLIDRMRTEEVVGWAFPSFRGLYARRKSRKAAKEAPGIPVTSFAARSRFAAFTATALLPAKKGKVRSAKAYALLGSGCRSRCFGFLRAGRTAALSIYELICQADRRRNEHCNHTQSRCPWACEFGKEQNELHRKLGENRNQDST
jgi:hypothetical protein